MFHLNYKYTEKGTLGSVVQLSQLTHGKAFMMQICDFVKNFSIIYRKKKISLGSLNFSGVFASINVVRAKHINRH